MGEFIPLKNLEVYKLSRELSRLSWNIYEGLEWADKRIMGEQFIKAIDSVGANISEGYRRYHYLERIKFYYIARASLAEACGYWLALLLERNKITAENAQQIKDIEGKLSLKLTNFIKTSYQATGK